MARPTKSSAQPGGTNECPVRTSTLELDTLDQETIDPIVSGSVFPKPIGLDVAVAVPAWTIEAESTCNAISDFLERE